MTPIDKAIKALERIVANAINAGGASCQPSRAVQEISADALQALSDLSSLKLEDRDVEKAIRIMKSARVSDLAPACVEHNAAVERVIAFLGHGGEGL